MEHNHKHTNTNDTLRDKILSQIKSEHITMRPRLYFTLRIVAVAVVTLLVLLLSVFIFNFILFSIRINSHDAFLGFGPRGILAFITFFPWPFLVLDVLLVFMLDWLLRTFKFGYRLPMLYVLASILFVTLATGFALDRGTYFNDNLMERAEGEHHLPPPFNALYGGARRPPHDGICRCTITEIGTSTITVEDYRKGATTTLTIILPMNDPRATSTSLEIGDLVMVAGDRDGNVIRAFGVRKAGEGRPMPIQLDDHEDRGELSPDHK